MKTLIFVITISFARSQRPSQSQPSTQTETGGLVTETDAPWGLAKISHVEPLGWGTAGKYVHDPSGGTNVNVYILDTGIHIEHPDFQKRAIWGTTLATDGNYDDDGEGPGTHYAGTVAGLNMTAMVEGVEWTIKDHKKRVVYDEKLKGSVIMLGIGEMPYSAKLVEVLDAAYETGIHIAVGAGDQDSDACASAAGPTKGLVVGAIDEGGARTLTSNSGSCVDIFAPGEDILSTLPGGRGNIGRYSGTAHAAAHVAGLMAYFISAADKGDSSPHAIKKKILDMAVKDRLHNIPEDTANLRAYNGAA